MSEGAVRKYSVKTVFLKICQNSQENTCTRVSFLIKLQARPAALLKKRFWHRCFPVNFAISSKTPFLTENLRWLLLSCVSVSFVREMLWKTEQEVSLPYANATEFFQFSLKIIGSPFYYQNFPDLEFTTALLFFECTKNNNKSKYLIFVKMKNIS